MASVIADFLSRFEPPNVETWQWESNALSNPWLPLISTALYLWTCSYFSGLAKRRKESQDGRTTPLVPHTNILEALHNLSCSLLALVMMIGLVYNGITQDAPRVWRNSQQTQQSPSGPLWYWVYIFYLSKFWELLDTVYIFLGGRKPATLHVWHHSTVVFTSWWGMQVGAVPFWPADALNCFVHVWMYAYYCMRCFGISPPWKKFVTIIQIQQFVLQVLLLLPVALNTAESFAVRAMVGFTVALILSFLVLFIGFYKKAYGASTYVLVWILGLPTVIFGVLWGAIELRAVLALVVANEIWFMLNHADVVLNPFRQKLDKKLGNAMGGMRKNNPDAVMVIITLYWAREAIVAFASFAFLHPSNTSAGVADAAVDSHSSGVIYAGARELLRPIADLDVMTSTVMESPLEMAAFLGASRICSLANGGLHLFLVLLSMFSTKLRHGFAQWAYGGLHGWKFGLRGILALFDTFTHILVCYTIYCVYPQLHPVLLGTAAVFFATYGLYYAAGKSPASPLVRVSMELTQSEPKSKTA